MAGRGAVGWLTDRLATWIFKLPAEQNGYTTEPLKIPVEDGVELAADLFHPVDMRPKGTILAVGPYGRSSVMAIATVRLFASRGYQCLLVSVRGTFGSGGTFRPGYSNAADGQAIVAWMRAQHWYTGSFATIGNSYLGLTQWALLEDQPADMVAAVVNVGPHDMADLVWGTGAFNFDLVVWANMVEDQEKVNPLLWGGKMKQSYDGLDELFLAVPFTGAVDAYFEHASVGQSVHEMMATSDVNDPLWTPMRHAGAVQRANLPILLFTGWGDVFLEQTMEQYRVLQERSINVGLTVGPWYHLTTTGPDFMSESFQWINQHLGKDKELPAREAPVRIHVGGADEWRQMPNWPPVTTPREMFLCAQKRLSREPPTGEMTTSFTFDPEKPTRAIGGPRLALTGPFVDTAFENKRDVAVFTSDKLHEDIEVLGKALVDLTHSSDNPYVDVFVRISDVDTKGKSRAVTEKYKRLDPRRTDEHVRLSLPDCAHRFKKGHCIRLIVAGGCHPNYARNLGTDVATGQKIVPRSATHTIHHGAARLSKVVLPVS